MASRKALQVDALSLFESATRSLVRKATDLHNDSVRAAELARVYIELRDFMDQASEIWKMLTDIRDKLAYEWVPEAFEAEAVRTLSLKEGYRVSIQGLVRASTRNMAAGIEWMRANGYEDVPKLTINASTLAALARSLAEKNEQLPDEIFNVFFGSNTSVTSLKS